MRPSSLLLRGLEWRTATRTSLGSESGIAAGSTRADQIGSLKTSITLWLRGPNGRSHCRLVGVSRANLRRTDLEGVSKEQHARKLKFLRSKSPSEKFQMTIAATEAGLVAKRRVIALKEDLRQLIAVQGICFDRSFFLEWSGELGIRDLALEILAETAPPT